ncbi:MAG: SMP-30/gluconolactonase/LRE family protein [Acidobacteria bacterium]|nr:SMP-30/gluconolactonase/LRE family protein [Acidobacteriota bacterium]
MSLSGLVTGDVQKVVGGFPGTEGPVFSRRGYLLFVTQDRIMKWERGTLSVFRQGSHGALGLTFDHQGRLLACETGRVTRTEKDGRISVLAGKGLRQPNDLVYSIDGSIYFTDLRPRDSRTPSRVYQIRRNGQVRVVSQDCAGPNGVALSPNQQKLYVADTWQRNVRIFDVAADGALLNGRIFCQVYPDGLKTDEAGNVWVAGEGGVWVFDAQGKHLGVVKTPEEITNCCWGEGFRGLYITARTSVYWVQTQVTGTRTY